MKLVFIGSTHWSPRYKEPRDFPFEQAAYEIGYCAARRGHTILVGSDREATFDRRVVEGARDCARNEPAKLVFVDVYYPERDCPPYQGPDFKLSNLIIRTDPQVQLTKEGSPNLIAHVAMLDVCDAVIALGGADNTFVACNIAANRKTPVFVVPSSGGSAQLLYDALRFSYATAEHRVLADQWRLAIS